MMSLEPMFDDWCLYDACSPKPDVELFFLLNHDKNECFPPLEVTVVALVEKDLEGETEGELSWLESVSEDLESLL